MIQASRETLVAAARVKYDNEDFISFLKSRLEKYRMDASMQRDEVSLRWAQGRAQELQDILELVENASALL